MKAAKTAKEKLIFAIVITICSVSAFFFFFTPGLLLGGINYISPDSSVRVTQLIHTRTVVDFSTAEVFELTDQIEHELNAEQIKEPQRLLQSSWYTRRFSDWVFYRISPDAESFYTYFIVFYRNHQC